MSEGWGDLATKLICVEKREMEYVREERMESENMCGEMAGARARAGARAGARGGVGG